MTTLFHAISQKIAIALTAALAGVSGLACQVQAPQTISPLATPAPQTALIMSAMIPLIARTSTTSTTSTNHIVPNLLPEVVLPPFLSTTTAQVKIKPPTIKPKLSVKVPIKIVGPTSTMAAPMPPPITAQSLLNETTFSLMPGLNSSEWITFTAALGGTAGTLSWNLDDTVIGGTGSVPQFDVVSSCTPPAVAPSPYDADQNPMLTVRTSYDCAVALTPTTGNDRRVISKDFNFETDPGRLVATVAPETDSLLQNNTNNGGFTFDNQDSQPVTITGLTVDVSFAGVTTSSLLVLRFADPVTGASLFDYPLGTISGSATDISIPLSLTIPANTQKVLPVQAIGVAILQVTGTNPLITVTLRGVSVSDGIAVKFISPQISWTCTVPTAAYDPYATSSPFLNGQTCGMSQ